MNMDPRLNAIADAQPCRLVFVTISGAHLYGFPSPDSDYDLRGVHILPAVDVLGLRESKETIEVAHAPQFPGDIDLDLVTHDIRKFMLLMLKKNGYVLEQLYSPLMVHTSPEHNRLKELGHRCVTRHHVHHYLGFSQNQWNLFQKEDPPRIKPLLYVYRTLLTGIHLMRTGAIEANLPKLNEEFKLSYVDELVQRKHEGGEQSKLTGADMQFHRGECERLESVLKEAGETSDLPETPAAHDELSELLVRLRVQSLDREDRP
jgi:uncharacterized protein